MIIDLKHTTLNATILKEYLDGHANNQHSAAQLNVEGYNKKIEILKIPIEGYKEKQEDAEAKQKP